MASIVLFDQATGRTKTISATLEAAVLHAQENGDVDYFAKMTVTANDLNGDAVPTLTVTSDDDLVLGTTQWDGTTTPYSNMTEAIDDYVLRIHQGIPGEPLTAIDFNS